MSGLTYKQIANPKITIEGEDIWLLNAFYHLEFYENINIGGVTGSLHLIDGDTLDYIGTRNIEFIEEFEFSFEDCMGRKLEFKGELNGLRREEIKKQSKLYIIDFSSKSVRMNELAHITRKIENKPPEDICKDMVEKYLDGELDAKGRGGLPMSWVPGRRKPYEVIRYALSHGVTQDNSASEDNEEAKGTSGYVFWETIDGFRFAPIDELMEGELYENHTEHNTQIAMTGQPIEVVSKAPITYDFPQVGDMHNKMRSGAYNSVYVSFDTNNGKYSEMKFEADPKKIVTEKQKEIASKPTRYLMRMFNNERFENGCNKAKNDTGDQSRRFLQQSVSRTNTFEDTQGRVVFGPNFQFRSGDSIELKIAKMSVNSEGSNKYDEKISGKYIISQVGHHISRDGTGYTKISVIRTVTQSHEQSNTSD